MLEIDVHEPERSLMLMATSVPCCREILNEHLWGDYRWRGISGKWTNVERKTWPEILADLNSVEDQLRRHRKNQPEARLIFVLEGMVEEDSSGTYTLQRSKNGVYVKGYKYSTRLSRILSWLYNASEFVEVFQTFSYEMTCQFLVQAYNQDQKEEHQTFNRYFKKMTFHPSPQVLALMGMAPGLGEVKAEALIEKFATVWNVLNASPRELMEVKGIGDKMALTLLRRVGRIDV